MRLGSGSFGTGGLNSQGSVSSARHAVAALLLLTSNFQTVPAAAQDANELARARALFQQATELEQAGSWSAAVQRFREVGQVRMTPQVQFHIALCEDKLGRLVAALGGYELALANADSVGPEFRAEVVGNVTRLRERIPKLVIQRGAGAQVAWIELDGVAVGDSSLGVELAQDPGPHVVSARAPNFRPFERTVALAEGERSVVEIVMDPEPRAAPVVASPVAGPQPPPARKVNWVPYVMSGAGVATLLVSGGFFVLRQSTQSGLDARCKGGVCAESERGAVSQLKTYHYVSFVTLGVGIAAVGTGGVLWALDAKNRKNEPASALRLLPSVSPDYAGISAVSAF